jgi:hypothetical protein
LKDDSGWFEWDLYLFFCEFLPVENILYILRFDFELITISNCTFQQDSNTVWESFKSGIVECSEVITSNLFTVSLNSLNDFLEGIWFGVWESKVSAQCEPVHGLKSTNNITLSHNFNVINLITKIIFNLLSLCHTTYKKIFCPIFISSKN